MKMQLLPVNLNPPSSLNEITNIPFKMISKCENKTLFIDFKSIENSKKNQFWDEISTQLNNGSLWEQCMIKDASFSRKTIKQYVRLGLRIHPCHLATYQQTLKVQKISLSDRKLSKLTQAALLANKQKVLKALKKIEINAIDRIGSTAIQSAVLTEDEEIVRLLIENGANVNLETEKVYPPLINAVLLNKINIVKILVEEGKADVNLPDSSGFPPIFYAAEYGYDRIFDLFVKHGVNINDPIRGSPFNCLEQAAMEGQKETVLNLIRLKALVNSTDKYRISPLYYTAMHGHHEICLDLLKAGAYVDGRPKHQWTPLMIAAFNNHTLVVKVLLDHHADVHAHVEGRTPFILANACRKEKNREILTLLSSQSKLVREYGQFYKHVKIISHLFHLSKTAVFSKNGIKIKLDRGGVPEELMLNKFIKEFNSFCSDFPDAIPAGRAASILEALEDLNKDRQPLEILDRCKLKKPTFIFTGTKSHSVVGLFWNEFFILCNRGDLSRKSVELFRYPATLFDTPEFVSTLLALNNSGGNEFMESIFNKFEPQCAAKQELDIFFEDECSLSEQKKAGNCVWTSLQQAVFALLCLEALQQHLADKNDIHQAIKSQRVVLRNIEAHMRVNWLEKYHWFIKAHPEYSDPVITSTGISTNRYLYPSLLKRVNIINELVL